MDAVRPREMEVSKVIANLVTWHDIDEEILTKTIFH